MRERVRRGGRAAGRRRHQALADQLRQPRAGPGRELPQDDRGDGPGPARHADQARRPAAQHAHDRGAGQAEAGADGEGDARGLRAARPPAGHPHASSGSSRTWRSQTLHPRRYAEIEAMVNQRRDDRERSSRRPARSSRSELEEAGIEADIAGRAKHFYSIYAKMAQGGKEFNEIYDLTAMRVLVDSVKDCYGAIGIIHSLWKPMPGRFKDYVAMPKFNMYQSLHTTVIGPQGKPLEIQVRTQRDAPDRRVRHRRALAVQGEGADRVARGRPDAWVRAARRLAGATPRDPKEFMETLRVDLFSDEVYVFTPEGRGQEPAGGRDAARLRLRRAHRRRPPLCRREGQRPDRAAALHAQVGRVRRGADVQAGAGPVARLAERSSRPPAPATRSASGSPSRPARTSSRRAATRCSRRSSRTACRTRRWRRRRCWPGSSARWASRRPTTSTSRSAPARCRSARS